MNLSLAVFVIHTITTMVSVQNTFRINNLLNKVKLWIFNLTIAFGLGRFNEFTLTDRYPFQYPEH